MIQLNITGDDAPSILKDLESLLAGRTLANVDRPAPVTPVAITPAPETGKKNTRNKAPAANEVIDQPKQTDIEEVTNKPQADAGEPMLTVDDAREHMKKFAADGNMDQVSAALAHFEVKKVSDIDPDAKGKPSAKFGAFVAKINELVAAKVV